MKLILLFVFAFPLIAFSQFEVVWVDSLQDDFSFTENWEYEEGIYVNQWGQLSCDAFCPEAADYMKDDQGRIYDDSLTAFYAIVDTTHRFFTHQGDVRAYAYSESNHAIARKLNGKLWIDTEVNMSTHTSLHMEFDSNPEAKLRPIIYLNYNSIQSSSGPIRYKALGGKVEISRAAYANGAIQMRFDLEFQYRSIDDDGAQTWKGRIFTAFY